MAELEASGVVGDAVRIGMPLEVREYAELFDCSSLVRLPVLVWS